MSLLAELSIDSMLAEDGMARRVVEVMQERDAMTQQYNSECSAHAMTQAKLSEANARLARAEAMAQERLVQIQDMKDRELRMAAEDVAEDKPQQALGYDLTVTRDLNGFIALVHMAPRMENGNG